MHASIPQESTSPKSEPEECTWCQNLNQAKGPRGVQAKHVMHPLLLVDAVDVIAAAAAANFFCYKLSSHAVYFVTSGKSAAHITTPSTAPGLFHVIIS